MTQIAGISFMRMDVLLSESSVPALWAGQQSNERVVSDQ